MLYQSGIKNAVATLGTATTPAHLRALSGYADRIYLLFDPDEAGEKATQKVRTAAKEAIDPEGSRKRTEVRNVRQATVAAARMKLDLRVLRLSEDPADWLCEHRPEEFAELLSGAEPILEYVFRHKIHRVRSADTAERSRAMAEIRDLLREIGAEDPIFYQDAIRLAAEALSINPEILEERRAPAPSVSPPRKPGPTDPLVQAGREVLALALAYPELTAELLKQGANVPSLPEPVMLKAEDFGDQSQARIFPILEEHAGEDIHVIVADERARPYLDLISALASEGRKNVITTDRNRRGESLPPSKADAIQVWLGLKLLSRERTKRQTTDYDEKDPLLNEIQALKEAIRTISTEP
jgi:DNA primase